MKLKTMAVLKKYILFLSKKPLRVTKKLSLMRASPLTRSHWLNHNTRHFLSSKKDTTDCLAQWLIMRLKPQFALKIDWKIIRSARSDAKALVVSRSSNLRGQKRSEQMVP